jgi:hypothetical protein
MNLRKTLPTLAVLASSLISPLTSAFAQEARSPQETSGTKPAAADAVKPGSDVTPPKLIHSVEPKLPNEIYKKGFRNIVVVKLLFTIQKDGTPADIHVLQIIQTVKKNPVLLDPNSDPLAQDLAKAAVDAASQFRFKPAKLNGEPVAVTLKLDLDFHPK